MTLLQESVLVRASPLLEGIEPGQVLPAEITLAEHAGVGRSVVRGLYRSLATAGHIRRRGRRWVVKRPLPVASKGVGPQLRSKRELVMNALLTRLTSGTLRPGERLSELSLSHSLGVSTVVVREAMLELQPLGAFEKKDSRHWTVAAFDGEKIGHLREFREMIEVFALQRLFGLLPDSGIMAALDVNRRQTEELLANHRATVRQILDVDLAFHRLLLEGAGNPLLLERAGFIYLIIEFQLVSPHFVIDRGKFGLRQHLRIHKAIRNGNHATAEKELRKHLRAAEQSFCSIVQCIEKHHSA